MVNNDSRISHISSTTSTNDSHTNPSSGTISPNDSPRSDDGIFRIFISHKHKDKIQAIKIKDELEEFAGSRLEIFLSEDIEAGEEWHDSITEELERSDWLILLYTDPTEEWDWCLYETGFFQGVARSKKPLICLHSSEGPPKPLENWQSIKATEEDDVIKKFLKPLFKESPRSGCDPLNSRFKEDSKRTKELAQAIIKAVGPKPVWKRFTYYMILTLKEKQIEKLKTTKQVPEDVDVESDEKSLEEIFGLTTEKVWTWKDILETLKDIGQAWTIPLGHAMWKVNEGRVSKGGLPIMRAPGNKNKYRPILYSYGSMSDKSLKFKIILNEIPRSDDPVPKNNLGKILKLLMNARRIRYGVIEKFHDKISNIRTMGADICEIDKCLDDFKWSFDHFMIESNYDNSFHPNNLIPLFEDNKEEKEKVKLGCDELYNAKCKIEDIFKKIDPNRENREKNDPNREQTLKNLEEIRKVLEDARIPNNDFMIVGMKRCQRMFEDLGKEMAVTSSDMDNPSSP